MENNMNNNRGNQNNVARNENTKKNTNVKTIAIVAGAAVAGFAAWKWLIKPAIAKRKAKKAAQETAEAAE